MADFCPPGQEKICLLIDYASASQANTPSFSTSRGVLNILQNHYVERLGQALIVNVNWFISAFFTAITPFLDPVTAKKIVMLRHPPGLQDYVSVEQLDAEFGGRWNYRFEFDDFWSQVLVRVMPLFLSFSLLYHSLRAVSATLLHRTLRVSPRTGRGSTRRGRGRLSQTRMLWRRQSASMPQRRAPASASAPPRVPMRRRRAQRRPRARRHRLRR